MLSNEKYNKSKHNYDKILRSRFLFWAQICEIRPNLAKNPPEPYFLP